MDNQSLRRLAAGGVDAVPGLEMLADWCWEQADNSGDARFCGIARALECLTSRWDSRGRIDTTTMSLLDAVLTEQLGPVLDADSPEFGAHLAKLMREDLLRVLREAGL